MANVLLVPLGSHGDVHPFVGNVVYAAGQFAMLTLLTKLLRPEFVGQYALGLALIYPLMMLTNMQLRSVMNSAGNHSFQ